MRERLIYIDIAKFIGIILVILGHMGFPSYIYNYIFSFHMPLFVILSGFVFKQENVWKQVRSLCVSFFSLILILSIVDIALKIFVVHDSVDYFSYIKAILGGAAAPFYRFDPAPAVWFLTALVVVEVASYLLSFLGKHKMIPVIILMIGGVFLSQHKGNLFIPWNIDVALFLIPFFELARELKKTAEKINKIPSWRLIIIGVVGLLLLLPLSQLNGTVNIFRCQYGKNIFLYYLNSLLGSSAVICLSVALSRLKHTGLICWMGKTTLIPMATHQMLLPVAAFLIGYIPYNEFVVVKLVAKAFELIILTVMSYTLAWFANQFCQFIFGRRKHRSDTKA